MPVRRSVHRAHNAPEHPHARGHHPEGQAPDVPAAPLNWLASRSAATAAVIAVKVPVLEQVNAAEPAPIVPPCPPACASRWLPVSSCSCRNPPVVRLHHHRAVQTERRFHPVVTVQKPLHLSIDLHRLPRLLHAALASVLVLDQEGSVALAGPTGMTAPSWKLCATGLHRSNARRCTSSAKTMIPWQHKPVASQENRKTWCCRRAWLVLPNPNPSRGPLPSRWRPCANGARKPRASVSGAEPWNCAQHAKPSR